MPTPRGMRDFPPEIMLLRRELMEKIERVFEKFGFDPMETPILELWESVAGKYGEEAEKKLMYWFDDPWSGRRYALRYDLTVPLARFIADHPGLPLPFKRYHIGRVYRHEEPQRGRYREFWQCDIDTIGSQFPEADAEILEAISTALRKIKLPGYVVRVNDRRILRGIFEKKLGIKNIVDVYRVIDKLDKIGWRGVKEELKKILPLEKVEKIGELVDFGGSFDDVANNVLELFRDVEEVRKGVEHLLEMGDYLKGVPLKFDLSLVRGLDYYTGPIFEIVMKEPKIGSVAGGGRYDELIGKLSGVNLPATGGSIGIERIIDAGIELGIFKVERKTVTQVFVVDMGAGDYARKIARELRESGINTALDLMRRKWKKQMEHARKMGVPVVVLVGKKEEREGKAVIIAGNRREEVRREEVTEKIRKILENL